MIIYGILADMKKEKGISWSYLESLINGYRGKFVDYKKGKTTFTDNEERKIANALGTTVEYLSGISKQKNKPSSEEESLSAEDKEALRRFRLLDENGQRLALAQLDAMISVQEENLKK